MKLGQKQGIESLTEPVPSLRHGPKLKRGNEDVDDDPRGYPPVLKETGPVIRGRFRRPGFSFRRSRDQIVYSRNGCCIGAFRHQASLRLDTPIRRADLRGDPLGSQRSLLGRCGSSNACGLNLSSIRRSNRAELARCSVETNKWECPVNLHRIP